MKNEIINIELIRPENNSITKRYVTPNGIHTHALWELVLFVDGTSINTVNDRKYTVSSGDIFLLNTKQTHAIEFISKNHLHIDTYYTTTDIENVLKNFPKSFVEIVNNKIIHLKLSLNDYESILNRISVLEKTQISYEISNDINQNELSHSLSLSLLFYFLGIYLEHTFDKSNQVPKYLYEFIQKVQDESVFTQRVSDIIKLTNYSHTQFLAMFKEYKKVTLIEYIIDLRLKLASDLLCETNDSVLDISIRCGYDSFSSFNKQFKQKYKMTPLVYRKAWRKKDEVS